MYIEFATPVTMCNCTMIATKAIDLDTRTCLNSDKMIAVIVIPISTIPNSNAGCVIVRLCQYRPIGTIFLGKVCNMFWI
jgi:hypothetical protein